MLRVEENLNAAANIGAKGHWRILGDNQEVNGSVLAFVSRPLPQVRPDCGNTYAGVTAQHLHSPVARSEFPALSSLRALLVLFIRWCSVDKLLQFVIVTHFTYGLRELSADR